MLTRLSEKTLQLIILLTVFLGFIGMANAQGVQITLQGTLDTVIAQDSNGNDDTEAFAAILPFSQGATVTATLRYFFDSEDLNDSENVGRFLTGSTEINVAGTVFESTSLLVDVLDENSSPGFPFSDEINTAGGSPWNAAGWDFNFIGAASTRNTIEITDFSGNVFDSDALPTEPFSIDDFSRARFEIFDTVSQQNFSTGPNTVVTPLGSHTGDSHSISGSFSSLTFQAIPEPASGLVLAVTALGLSLTRRRSA